MKVVIVEIKNSFAAALSEDGRVLKIKNKNYAIGQEIIFKNNNNYIKLAASIAASLVLFVTPAWAYLTPYSYVSLDINPSFEFLINRFDRVLEVRAVNDDGEKVVDKISIAGLKNKEIKDAVKSVIVELKEQGYIIEGKEGGVVLAASSRNQEKVDKLSTSLKTAVEEEITISAVNLDKDKKAIKQTEKTEKSDEKEESTEIEANEEPVKSEEDKENKKDKEIKEAEKAAEKAEKDIEKKEKEKGKFAVEVVEVSQDEVDEAKVLGVTPGKRNLVEKLQRSAENAGHKFDEQEFKDWLDEPVQDIMKEIKKYNEEELEKKKESKEDKEDKEDKEEVKSNKEEKSNKETIKKQN